jgi:uncharacterized protein
MGGDRVFAMERWFQMTQTAVFGSALCWLYSSGRFAIAFQSLELIGKMTLTNYLLQNLLALALFSGVGLGLLHQTSYAFTVEIAALVFVLQVFFSHWWPKLFSIRSHRMAVALPGLRPLVPKQAPDLWN